MSAILTVVDARQDTQGTPTVVLAPGALRKVPIIFVPGIMGTRLTDPDTGDLVWNPTGFPLSMLKNGPGPLAAKVDRIRDVSKSLVPDMTHPANPLYDSGRAIAWYIEAKNRQIANFTHIIPDFYGDLVVSLHRTLTSSLKGVGVEPRLYCCGYDWRVDNAVSAQLLATVVQQAQQECGASTVILVAHSMGGLVCRHYCKNMGGESNVLAQFLLASPSLGAPNAYATLKGGMSVDPVRILLGFVLNATSRDFARKIPGIWQLLPNTRYCKVKSNWAVFDGSKTGIDPTTANVVPSGSFSDASDAVLFFQDVYTGLSDVFETRGPDQAMFLQSLAFHASLLDDSATKIYMHPKTYVAYCADNGNTPTQCTLTWEGITPESDGTYVASSHVDVTTTADGDGTVPQLSANPADVTNTLLAPIIIKNTDHQSLPGESATCKYVAQMIGDLLGAKR